MIIKAARRGSPADALDFDAVTSVKVFPAPVILSEAKNPFSFAM